MSKIAWLTQTRVLKKFGTTNLEARQAIVKHTSKIIDAELDISIIQESTQIGIFGSEEFAKEIGEFKSPSASASIEIQFEDLIVAAQTEFQLKISEISSDSREKRL